MRVFLFINNIWLSQWLEAAKPIRVFIWTKIEKVKVEKVLKGVVTLLNVIKLDFRIRWLHRTLKSGRINLLFPSLFFFFINKNVFIQLNGIEGDS